MKKKPSKDIIIYQQNRAKQCEICHQNAPNLVFATKILAKKYYQPQIESYHFRNLNDIIFDEHSSNYLSYEQMVKDTSQQLLKKYNDWNQIVHSIKNSILQRCKDNFYGYVDFMEECHEISLKHYLRKKQFLKRRKINTPYKSSLSTQQTAEDRNLLQCLESKILNRNLEKIQSKKIKQTVIIDSASNVSLIQLRRLTKKLDLMVGSILRKPRKSSRSKKDMLSPKKCKLPLNKNFINLKSFKKQLQKKISVIDKNQQDMVKLNKVAENQCERFLQINDIKQTYGLKVFKPNPTKRHPKLLSSEKISAPMTPKPRFQFANNEYEQRFVAQTPRAQTYKLSSPQSPCPYRTNCSSRNSTTPTKSLTKIRSPNGKSKATKVKPSSSKLKK